jgi:hypothetical protein
MFIQDAAAPSALTLVCRWRANNNEQQDLLSVLNSPVLSRLTLILG